MKTFELILAIWLIGAIPAYFILRDDFSKSNPWKKWTARRRRGTFLQSLVFSWFTVALLLAVLFVDAADDKQKVNW